MQNTQKGSTTKVLGAAALAGTVGAVVGATAAVLSDEKRRKQVVGVIQDLKKQGNMMLDKAADVSQQLKQDAKEEGKKMEKVVTNAKKEGASSKK